MIKAERKMCHNCPDKGIICDRCIIGMVYDAEDWRLKKIRRKESKARFYKVAALKAKC